MPASSTMPKLPPKRSTRTIVYACTNCGATPGRDKLTVKRVEFATIGANWRRLKSRTVAWLCPKCLEKDPAWTQDSVIDAPGLSDIREARKDEQ